VRYKERMNFKVQANSNSASQKTLACKTFSGTPSARNGEIN
jgi:hypothetical protein